jgi:8-oxo-dGTP pyrophosphatase MutT (NUDIX family)
VPVLERREVVTAFLRYRGEILLVRRSDRVGTYQGCWSAISGYLEEPTPLAQAKREIREETGLTEKEARLVKEGEPLEIPAPELGCCWVVHPFLFDIADPEQIRLDWENLELRWVAPSRLKEYETVPKLREAYMAVTGQPSSE